MILFSVEFIYLTISDVLCFNLFPCFFPLFFLSSFFSFSFLSLFFIFLSFRFILKFLSLPKLSTSSVPAFFVPGTNVIRDAIVLLDEEIDSKDTSLKNKLAGSAADVQSAEFSYYRYEEMCASVEQMADHSFPLWDIQSRHVNSLSASIRALVFDYRTGMITATWFASCNLTESSMQDAVADDDDGKFVEECFKMIILHGRRQAVVRTSSKQNVDVGQAGISWSDIISLDHALSLFNL